MRKLNITDAGMKEKVKATQSHSSKHTVVKELNNTHNEQ